MLPTEEPVGGCGYRGLFGAIGKDATVKNVAIAACNMRGWNNVGAVAGVNEGTIKDCHVVFSIMSSVGSGMNLGGMMTRSSGGGCPFGSGICAPSGSSGTSAMPEVLNMSSSRSASDTTRL